MYIDEVFKTYIMQNIKPGRGGGGEPDQRLISSTARHACTWNCGLNEMPRTYRATVKIQRMWSGDVGRMMTLGSVNLMVDFGLLSVYTGIYSSAFVTYVCPSVLGMSAFLVHFCDI